MEKLRQVVSVSRNCPAVFAVHKVELNNVFTVGEILLQASLRARRFPRGTAVVGAVEGSLDGSGRTGAMRFGTPYPSFPDSDEVPNAGEFDRSGGAPT